MRQSLLSYIFLFANREGSSVLVLMDRLVWAFTICQYNKFPVHMDWHIIIYFPTCRISLRLLHIDIVNRRLNAKGHHIAIAKCNTYNLRRRWYIFSCWHEQIIILRNNCANLAVISAYHKCFVIFSDCFAVDSVRCCEHCQSIETFRFCKELNMRSNILDMPYRTILLSFKMLKRFNEILSLHWV